MSSVRQRTVPGQQQKEALMAQADIKAREEEQQILAAGQKFVPPPFTIKQLLDAIPAHCYQRSAIKSSQYILQDFIAIGALVWTSFQVNPFLSSLNLPPVAYQLARAAAHTAITIFLGFFGTGLWIIAHECGHQAFSESKTINNSVGWVLHSALLVPYHSWRISHGRHHAATGHISRDEVFVPRTRSQLGVPEIKEEAELEGISISQQRQEELKDAIGDAPIVVLGHLIVQQLFGWPAYLIRNASGQKSYPPMTNHFQPSSVIFKPDHWSQIIGSDIGLLITFATLAFWVSQRGFKEVATLYIIPYLIVNSDLVGITFLQHTDPLVPHYSPKEWTFARGALTTVDRKFLGPLGKHVLHGICETHVAHHVSSKIPHYSAWEATAALKEFIGEHYQYRDTNFVMDLFRHYRSCRFVEDSGDVLFYKNARGVAAAYALPEDVYQADSGVDISADKKKQEQIIASI